MEGQVAVSTEIMKFLSDKIINDDATIIKTCCNCAKETNNFFYVDCCHRIYCAECEPDMVINEGIGADNPIYTCKICLNARHDND